MFGLVIGHNSSFGGKESNIFTRTFKVSQAIFCQICLRQNPKLHVQFFSGLVATFFFFFVGDFFA